MNYGDQAYTGSVMKVAKAGGSAVTLVSEVDSPRFIALSGGFVYFAGGFDGGYWIKKVATTGGAVTTLSIESVYALAVDGSAIYASTRACP